jgi:aminoglycoside phosphotransferase (APT) family kinase protein
MHPTTAQPTTAGRAEAPESRDEMVAALVTWLSQEAGQPVSITAAERTSYGYSRENWVIEAAWGGQRHDLIVRRDPPGSLLATDRQVEVAVLRALAATDVPVPAVRWADLNGEHLGRPSLVMDLCRGSCQPIILNGPLNLDHRQRIAAGIYDQLIAIHRVDWRTISPGVLDDPGERAARVALDSWAAQLEEVRCDPEPELAYAIAWLRARAPAAARTTLVHGDFKPGNVLLLDGAVSAVLDWETAHLGDPHEDLGWVTNPVRAREHRIEGAWEPGHLLDRWSSGTGWAVDRDALRWWQAFANLKLSVILLRGIREFLDGRLDRAFPAPWPFIRMLLSQIAD